MPIEIESLSTETRGALPLWIQRVIAWANRAWDIIQYDITGYESSAPEMETESTSYEPPVAKMEKQKELRDEIIREWSFIWAVGSALVMLNAAVEKDAKIAWVVSIVFSITGLVNIALSRKRKKKMQPWNKQEAETTDTHHEITLVSLSLEERAMLGEAISRASN